MHTLHWIAVEAESLEEAESIVTSNLADSYGEGAQWWDWFDTDIGGRWSENSKTTCLNNSDEYKETLERIKVNRKAEMKQLLEGVNLDEFISAVNQYEGDKAVIDYDLNTWRVRKMAELLGGDWHCDSHFYDMESWSCNLNYLDERVKTNPSNQYLVPIDFHF